MAKPFILCCLCFVVFTNNGFAQTISPSAILPASAHVRTADKNSWQQLNLLLSSTYYHVAKEGQVDLDNSLKYCSRLLGLSRVSVLGEGIDDQDLLKQSQWIDGKDPGHAIRLLSSTKGKRHLDLLVLLGAYYAFEPQSYSYHRDSVEYFLFLAIKESNVLHEEKTGRQALCLLGKMYVQANEVVKGDSVFNLAIKASEAKGDKETAARAYAYRGLYTAYSPQGTANRVADLIRALELFYELKNTEGAINALTNAGYLYMTTNDFEKAHEVFLKAFQLEDSIQYPYVQYNTDALVMVTAGKGRFGEPLKYAIQSVNVAESASDSIGWAYFYARLASLYKLIEPRKKESVEWMYKSLNRFIGDRNPALYNLLWEITDQSRAANWKEEPLVIVSRLAKQVPPSNYSELFFYHLSLASCYINLDRFDLAASNLLSADSLETIVETFRGPLRRPMIDIQYGNMYLKMGQFVKARASFQKYLASPSFIARTLDNALIIYKKLIYVDSILADRNAAMTHYKEYTALLDSSFRVSSIRQAEELQLQYQTAESQNQITVLNQQALLEKANLKQAMLVKNITIGGIIAAILLAALLYRQNRLKQRHNNLATTKNEQLGHLLTEKEWLLKEIHHRVKNNLQLVMSLLNSQSAYIDNEPALTAIHDSQHRVQAMSLIHQKLYVSDNVSTIDMTLYIHELVSYLGDSFSTGQRIWFVYDIDPIELDVSHAIPLGLIMNEAITNSIKYAFPNNADGKISIALKQTGERDYLLTIADSGIGLSSEIDKKRPGSLGMSLMMGLSEDLDGQFSVANFNGTVVKISFSVQ